MKKRLHLFLLLIFLFSNNLFAQKQPTTKDFATNYVSVKATGEIPNDLCTQFTQAYNNEKAELDKNKANQSGHVNKTKDKFLQESNYFINQILLSGKVLYNTPLNTYIEKITDKILINEPELRKQIRIYILKTPTVNASATDKGILFVNLGLIAQAGSESQLAFIISHELIHYIKKHSMDLYLERDKISRENRGFKSASLNEVLYKTHYRSREMENEADEKGFTDYFIKTNYDLNQATEIYDVLQYAYLPFDELTFNPSFLSDSLFTFPSKYIPETINPIRARDDYDDENSTHPNIKKRREQMQERLSNIDNKNKIINPQGEEYYKTIRDMARFECLRLYVVEQNFSMSFYNAWLMKKDYPNNLFLDQVLSASLYGMTKYKNRDNISDILPSEKKTEGEIHAVVSLFKNIKKNELNALALRFVWKAHHKNPNDAYLNHIKDDLFKELVWKNKAKLSMFVNTPQIRKSGDSILAELPKSDSIQKQSSKVRNIEKKKKTQNADEFYAYIFADLLKDNDFSTEFKQSIDNFENIQRKKKEDLAKLNKENQKDYKDDESDNIDSEDESDLLYTNRYRNFGCRLGIDTVLLYNPFYMKFDYRKTQKIKFFDTESSQLSFIELLKKNAKRVGLTMETVLPSEFKENGTSLYNKHLLLNDWTDEFSNWDISGDRILFLSEEIKPIINEYQTKYLNITGVISAKASSIDNRAFSMLLYGALSPVMWPVTLQYFVRPAFQTVYYNELINMETGKTEFVNSSAIEMSDNKSYLNSRIYDTFNQIKTK
ncbi:MAG: M48 family metalloprotease [Bacteroidetes bacterium]|nr:M48 family metalloprotease [Bacteroidota bacterium]